jgi:transketolase
MSTECPPELRQRVEQTIRFLAVDAVKKANSGHVGAPMSLAAAALELFDHHLRFDPTDPAWPLRDRFVLSNGHASMLQYALLHLFGYDLSIEDIKDFRQLGAATPGHPEYGDTPGVELTTGPLGQGFAHGVGMALGARMTRAQFAGDASGEAVPGDHFVYGIVSDGDLMEGISHEAASFAGHLGLGNLIYVYDDNEITIDGRTEIAFSDDVPARFEAQGWQVLGPVDGQDVAGLAEALDSGRAETARPTLIVLKTKIGLGSPDIVDTSKAHGAGLTDDTFIANAKNAAGWPLEPTFLVPDEVEAYLVKRRTEKRAEREARDAALASWREANRVAAAAWDAARRRDLPADLAAQLCEGMDVEKATRQHSGAVLQKLSTLVPYMAGGSADLAGSAAPPIIKDVGIVSKGDFAGRNIHFGIREHAMAAISNGIALDGTFLPYCGTFMIFSDYMRPAIRLAALMKVPTIFVFTHDSIFVGEDGPTHQPIEQVDSLRLIPGLRIWRPADGAETALAYAQILESGGPAALSLTRQSVPVIERPAGFGAAQMAQGAYVVRDTEGAPDVVLMASGSEVGLCLEAAEQLTASGIGARVVSAPCTEIFAEQPASVQEEVVPEGVPVVAVEAGRGQAFARYTGRRGAIHGMNRFGASAPAKALADHFGFTADAVCKTVQETIGRS